MNLCSTLIFLILVLFPDIFLPKIILCEKNFGKQYLLGKRWENGTVPYLLDDKFLAGDRAKIRNAIQLIQEETCVRIIPRTAEKNYVLIRKDSEDCDSAAGMIGGKQMVKLAPKCITKSTAHELMHVIGFVHEHNRLDRDNYIVVHYENIKNGSKYLFDKIEGVYGNMFGAYDVHSITHYGNLVESKNGRHTIDPIDGSGRVGQRWRLTALDIEKINKFYSCGKKTKSSDSSDDNSETFGHSTEANLTSHAVFSE